MPPDDTLLYVRDPNAAAVSTARRILFTKPGEDSHLFADLDSEKVSFVWETLAAPTSGAELVRVAGNESKVASRIVDTLVEHGFVLAGTREELVEGREPATKSGVEPVCSHLVLCVSGCAQAVFIPSYVEQLLAGFAEKLDVVLTSAAQEFVRGDAIARFGVNVWTDPFYLRDDVAVPHVHLAKSARLVLLLPASAHTIFRLSHGACSDLISLVAATTKAPVVVVPSMNPAMWRHPAVRRNVSTLRADGAFVVEPGLGFEIAEDRQSQPMLGPAALGPDGASLLSVLCSVLEMATVQE